MRPPPSFSETIEGPESSQWWKAMQRKIKSINDNKTWTLSDVPADQKVVGSKWVFKRKTEKDGSTRYKARFVAKDYSQIKGTNYNDTFSSVARFTSLCIMFAYAAREGLTVHHFDIETAFLHGDLEEEVYLQQPDGFTIQGEEQKVCRLRKTIYGLKQGSKAWNKVLNSALKEINMQQSTYDSCLYYFFTSNKKIIIVVFVADMMVASDSPDFVLKLKEELRKRFPVKDLGLA